jgi:hypothetical protein
LLNRACRDRCIDAAYTHGFDALTHLPWAKLDNFDDAFWSNFSLEKECDHEMKTLLSGTDCLKFQASRALQGNEQYRAPVGHFGPTFYRWKKQYAGMLVEGVRELEDSAGRKRG